MFVCCECCVLSGRGLCEKLITRPEESYRLWFVVVCDLENLKNEEAITRVGPGRHKKEYPLHVLSRFTAYHQEVLFCIYINWHMSCVYVDWLLAGYRKVPIDDDEQ